MISKISADVWSTVLHFLSYSAPPDSTNDPSPLVLIPTNTTQSYHIPKLYMHMISERPGWPGDPDWNPIDMFNTTIKFDVSMPSLVAEDEKRNVTCAGSWVHDVLPEDPIICTGEGGREGEEVMFSMIPYYAPGSEGKKRRNDLSYELSVGRMISGAVMTGFVGAHNITANDLSKPTGFIMCVGGAPGTGLKCDLWPGSKKLVLEAKGYTIGNDGSTPSPPSNTLLPVSGDGQAKRMQRSWKA